VVRGAAALLFLFDYLLSNLSFHSPTLFLCVCDVPSGFFIDAGIYGAIYLAVNLLSSILTNNAAAILAFPIAMLAVNQTGTDRLKMAFIIMLSASDYITSFGYQTNLMVYGAGGYSNMDYLRFGAPMQLLLWLSSTAMISASSPDAWYISWIITVIAFVVIVFLRLLGGSKYFRKDKKPELNPTTTMATPNGRLTSDDDADELYA
jgi:hypothetical protein